MNIGNLPHWLSIVSLLWFQLGPPGCVQDQPSRPDAGQDGIEDADGDGAAETSPSDDTDSDVDADTDPVELRITGVLPSRGPIQGGTWANIIGSGFVYGIAESPFDVRDVTDVNFGDNAAIDIEVIRDDMISVRTPLGLSGPTRVTVTNPNGSVSLEAAFTYFDTLRIDSIDQTDFRTQGSTPFQLTGTGFTEDTIVLVGDRHAYDLEVVSATQLNGLAPPGQAGQTDLNLVNRNGDFLLFRAITYHETPRLTALDPASGPTTGATSVTATGNGFSAQGKLLIDNLETSQPTWVDSQQMSALTPAHQKGSVDVTYQGVLEKHTLEGGYVYLDAPTTTLALLAAVPHAGPTAGGQTVTIVGDGFVPDQVSVSIAGVVAPVVEVSDAQHIIVTTPAGSVGSATIEINQDTQSVQLEAGYRYYEPLVFESIDPARGPDTGGTEFVLRGHGFSPSTRLSMAGKEIAIQIDSANQLVGTSLPGPPGSAPLELRDQDSLVLIPNGFVYTASLSLFRISPDVGSQAGGTFVTLYGKGFSEGVEVKFGDLPAQTVQIHSDSVLTARTPAGVPGEVPVRISDTESSALLDAGFTYFDPTNDRGGASGGAIIGSLNITVLDGTWTRFGAPLPEADVYLSQPTLTAKTDQRGQITFSGPSLVREVTLTVAKEGYESITLANINASNLTVYLYPNEQEPVDPTTIEVTYSAIAGRVFGFKDVPGLPSGPTINYEARVNFTSYSIYSVPPYGGIPQGTPILQDGDAFGYNLRLGNYSLYALFGAYDTVSDDFIPALLGVRRDIQVVSADPVLDQDIVLTTPLDQSIAVHLEDPPLGTQERPALYYVNVSLDLGPNGIIYLNGKKTSASDVFLSGLPKASGDSFIFVCQASLGGGYPVSYGFRRQAGQIDQGITMGPFLGFTTFIEPTATGELSNRIAWAYTGPTPQLAQLYIQTAELMPKTLWRIVVSGETTEVELPQEILASFPHGEPLLLQLYTANSPRFNFDRFNYSQLSYGRWTHYTINSTNVIAP